MPKPTPMRVISFIVIILIVLSCSTKEQSPIYEFKNINGIQVLCKWSTEEHDDQVVLIRKTFENIINEISVIDTFHHVDIEDGDLCFASNRIFMDWDYTFGTNLDAQKNLIIGNLSPSGRCDDNNVFDIAIVDYGKREPIIKECNKMYSFFEKGGNRDPFFGYMTCFEENGFLVMIEFFYRPDRELLLLFDHVTNFKK